MSHAPRWLRIAAASHETISLEAGDTVIYSSRQIPGNENAIARVQDMLVRRKIKLVTDQEAPVHVSGHPSRDEMIEMYRLIRPKIAIRYMGLLVIFWRMHRSPRAVRSTGDPA